MPIACTRSEVHSPYSLVFDTEVLDEEKVPLLVAAAAKHNPTAAISK
jgi:hypothetical protein